LRYLAQVKREEPGGERLIKRYENRKLYDTATRAYVTLDELARLIAEGHEIRVVDQKSHEDLTSIVLAQVILEGLKQRSAAVPRQVLARLIRLGVRPSQRAGGRDPLSRARDEAERIANRLIARGRLSLEEALALRQEITQSLQRVVSDTQRNLEDHFHSLLDSSEREGGVSPALSALRERLLTLETYIGRARPPTARERRRRSA
jgi:polyhydroxyalkanoate synthesis repressor PhaR